MKRTKKILSFRQMCLVENELEFDLIELEEIPFLVFMSYDMNGYESKGLLISLN